jgi:hypothetical protein
MQDYSWTYFFFKGFALLHGENSFSPQFRLCLEKGLAEDLKLQTGLIISKTANNFVLGLDDPYLELGVISYCNCYTDTVTYAYRGQIAWKSKSGRIYHPTDMDIDPDDISFWFSKLAKEEIKNIYFKQKSKPWFKTSHLTFEVVVGHLVVEGIYLYFSFIEANPDTAPQIEDIIGDFIIKWNEKREQQQRRKGLIHNASAVKRTDTTLVIYIDMGSANAMRQLLEAVDTLGVMQKVEITSLPEKEWTA